MRIMMCFLVVVPALFFINIGCGDTVQPPSLEDNIRAAFEKVHIPKMNDPDSYEFVEIKKVDSLFHTEDERPLVLRASFFEGSERDSVTAMLAERRAKNDVRRFESLITCRGANKLGAKVIVTYLAVVDTDFNIVQTKLMD